jgi:hypothetical protein
MSISPLAARALRVINHAWTNGTAYDLASQAAFALEAAGLLVDPAVTEELGTLRKRVAELAAERDELRAQVVEQQPVDEGPVPYTLTPKAAAAAARLSVLLAPPEAGDRPC